MIQTTLAFDQARRGGQPPQLALVIQLINATLVIVGDGVSGLDAGVLYRLDGSRILDGSWTLGADVQTVHRGLVSVGDLRFGDSAGGDPVSSRLAVLPTKRTTLHAEVENATGLIGDVLANEPLVGKRGELRATYPGLSLLDMATLFAGEVYHEDLDYERLALDLRSA